MGFSENKHKIVAFLLLFLVMVGIAVAMYLKSQGLEIKNISVMEFLSDIASTNDNKVIKGNDYVVNYDAKEHPTFSIYKDLVIKCTRDYLTALNKKGEEQWKIPVLLNKPLIKTAGQDLLVADIGGRDVYVIKGRNIKWEIKTDDNIINADISESGHVTVVQEQKGYKAKVITYDSNGMDIFTRNIVESFVVSAMVSPSGKQVLINGLDVSGVNATTTFEFTDILGNPFAAKVPIQNEIFPSVWYFSDNSVASVGENVVVFLDKNRDVKWEKEFNGITSSAVLQDKYIAIASAGTGNTAGGSASVTEIFGTNGRKAAQYPLPEGVISLNAYSDMLGINTGREVYFINSRGRFAGKYVSKADITGVYFFNKLEAAVVTKTNVAIFHIGG